MTKTRIKISDTSFMQFVAESHSIRGVLIKCDLAPRGGNYRTCASRIKRLQCDTSHFTGQRSSKGKTFPNRHILLSDYLSNKVPICSSNSLKKKLLQEKVKEHYCENCHLSAWNDLPIPLELHHVDGNVQNNNLSNLLLLCPNCHAQTDNYRGKNQVRRKLRSVLPL